MEAAPIPLVVHGARACRTRLSTSDPAWHAKINISTQLKITLADSYRTYLEEHPTEYDPLKLLAR